MRCSSFLLASALSLSSSAINLPFALDWLVTGSRDALSADVVPHKIAVIGAGAGGSSAAFWIQKAKSRTGVAVEVDVYERESYVGGRSTVVYPFNDTSLYPVELGASIFVEVNKNLWRASEEFGLSRINFDDDTQTVGFWDGEKFVFTMESTTGMFGWWSTVKTLWRYGYKAPMKTRAIVQRVIDKFVTIYNSDRPQWSNITSLASEFGWSELAAQSTSEYLDLQGVYRLWTREVVEAATRVNYGQNVDTIHLLEGACSMAASGASSIQGGNFQIYQNFLARSGANVYLNTTVHSISETRSGAWSISSSSKNGEETKTYDDVIIAAPFHSTGINLSPSSWSFSKTELEPIPPQPYVHLHVTLLSTTTAHPNPEYFGLKAGTAVPQTVLTTYEGVRNGGKEPEFNSLTYHGPIGPGRTGEFVVKIFSKERIDDEWLNIVFDGKVGWVHRKEWDAYPKLPPMTTFPPVIVAKGLYYVNAFEPLISTMETETISSRNVVDLLFESRFGSGICGKSSSNIHGSDNTGKEQVVLGSESEQPQLKAPTTRAPKDVKDEKFVYGWDC